MELDHLFIITTPSAPEIDRLEAIGLTPTYRREHVGQGTANVCYCFENAFLEVLWVSSVTEAQSPSVARMQLSKRAEWPGVAANPFGIAWRGSSATATPTWPCTPPYLPAGMAIDVAKDSDDLAQPLMFTFPGANAPREWPSSRRGGLQAAGGFSQIELRRVWLPRDVQASPALLQLAAACHASINVGQGRGHGLDLALTRADSRAALNLRLPECAVIE
jgi:Glyoxalase-like domain